MAKIQEEYVVVKLSKLLKNNESSETIVTPEVQTAIEDVVAQVVGELVQDPSVVIEVDDGSTGS